MKRSVRRYLWQKMALILSFLLAMTVALVGCNQTQVAQPSSVTVLGQFAGEQQKSFELSLAPFEAKTGIDVIYESTDAFTSLIETRVGTGKTPDLAIFPQPGLMADYAQQGLLVPLTNFMHKRSLKTAYPDTWLDLGAVEGELYAIWYRASVKSLVWYRPTAFEAKGYDIPNTWSALVALSDRIVAEGGTPWCIGLESGEATGWPATDWVEDILLRKAGPEAYSQWIDHQLPFSSPEVIKAFDEFGKFLKTPQYVYESAAQSADISYEDAILGIFKDPPDCYLHRQGNFIADAIPTGKEPRVDYDVFPLPGIDERFGMPILVGGDAIAMFHSTPASRALMSYLASPTPAEIRVKLGGFISPQKQIPVEAYPNAVDQKIVQILIDADTIRFDASDLMPGSVGTGSFWQGMIDFAKGKSATEVAKEIDDSWPK
ncbi:MAG: ABC transporter substrate-binding protein [Phormidesmis sp.]